MSRAVIGGMISEVVERTAGERLSRLVESLQSAPSGCRMHGQPGSGRGGARTGGGSGGYPMAAVSGSSQGKLQGKLLGSFISIQRASISTPSSGEKKIRNSLSQYELALGWNQSGNAVTPGHTTPFQIVLFSARLRKMSAWTPRSNGG